MMLERMRTAIKNFPCSMDRVSYDNDFGNGFVRADLINATPNGKELRLCTSYEHSMIYNLCDWPISDMDMRYKCSDIIFDASI